MIKYQMFIAVALLVGVAIGYFVKDEPVAASEPAKVEETVKKPVADKGDEATVKALRHRIAELEKALAEKGEKAAVAISNAVAEARPPERPQMNWRERIEEMKKNDPERYNEMTNRMAQWRRDQAARNRDKIDFLSSVDLSLMSAGAKKTHQKLQALVTKREEIEDTLHKEGEGMDDAMRDELMRELHQTHWEMHQLNEEERKNLLEATARSLGFEERDAKEITATIQDVIEATDNGWGGRRRGGPRGPGGPNGR